MVLTIVYQCIFFLLMLVFGYCTNRLYNNPCCACVGDGYWVKKAEEKEEWLL